MNTQNFSQDDAQFNYETQARALADIERCGIKEIVCSAKDQGLELVKHYAEFTFVAIYTGYDENSSTPGGHTFKVTALGPHESLSGLDNIILSKMATEWARRDKEEMDYASRTVHAAKYVDRFILTSYKDEDLFALAGTDNITAIRANLASLFVDVIQQADRGGEAFKLFVANASEELGPVVDFHGGEE